MKLSELREEQLKQELSKLALPSMVTMNELQRRLREELRNRGVDIDIYEFENEEERELQAPATPRGNDLISISN